VATCTIDVVVVVVVGDGVDGVPPEVVGDGVDGVLI
jgi:hypothetical protein